MRIPRALAGKSTKGARVASHISTATPGIPGDGTGLSDAAKQGPESETSGELESIASFNGSMTR